MRDIKGLTLSQLRAVAVIIAATVAAMAKAEDLGMAASCETIEDDGALSLVVTPEDAE